MKIYDDSLQHYGVLGMKWGIRRYQNKDGSLTAAGQKHYEKTGEYGYKYKSMYTKAYDKAANKASKKAEKYANSGNLKKQAKAQKRADRLRGMADRSRELDRRMENFARHEKLGKHLLLRFLSGGYYGTKPMMTFMATAGKDSRGGAQAAATGQTFINGLLNPFGAYAWSDIQRWQYMRGKDNTFTMKNTRSLHGKRRQVGDGK